MNQEKIRDELLQMKNYFGVSYKSIAYHSGVSYDTIRSFACGRRTSEKNLEILSEYLQKLGFLLDVETPQPKEGDFIF